MDFLFLSTKDSLREHTLHLAPLVSSRKDVREEGVGAVTSEQEVAENLGEVQRGEEDEGREQTGQEEAEDEEDTDEKSKREDHNVEKEQTVSKKAVDSKKEEGELESDEVQEECSGGGIEEKDGGVTENIKYSESYESSEGEEDVEVAGERRDDEADNVESLLEEVEDQIPEEELEEDSDGSFERDVEGEDECEISTNAKEANSNGEQEMEKEDDGESEDALERCSLSQRKLEEVLERCMESEAGDTGRDCTEGEHDLDAQRPQAASASDEEAVEVFEMDATLGQKMMLSDHQQKTVADEENVTEKCPLPSEVGFAVASVRAHTSHSYTTSPSSRLTFSSLHGCTCKSNSTALRACHPLFFPA